MNEHEADQEKIDQQVPDESRPLKRVRLEAPLSLTQDMQQEIMDGAEDDWSDVYGDKDQKPSMLEDPSEPAESKVDPTSMTTAAHEDENARTLPPPDAYEHQYGVSVEPKQEEAIKDEPMDGVPAEAIEDKDNDDLVAPSRPPADTVDQASVAVMEEATEVECQPEQPKSFSDAAAEQKGDKNAEWKYDSSDVASTSSDSDTSDDSSDDDDDDDSDAASADGYEMMDPATIARMLMSEEGDDEDGDRSKRKQTEHKPRTVNEQDEAVVKPNITIGPEDEITLLGTIEAVVDNMILINGAISGEYQALEPGSAVCNEKREVLGAVTDTLGQVREPKYIVTFNSRQEIEDLGLLDGIKIFYVNKASTFVFTAPLRNLKGTDASNIHDEEIGENEIEFSDDEEEAEYKRQRKAAKKSGKAGPLRSEFQSRQRTSDAPSNTRGNDYTNGRDAPSHNYGGGLSYDDDEGSADEFYKPLQRPDNLPHLMGSNSLPPRPPLATQNRGGMRGRGDRGGRVGRGDRGRGRGRSNYRGRGDRPNFSQDTRSNTGYHGSSNSFSNHNPGYDHGRVQQPNAFTAPSQHPQQHQPPNSQPYQQHQPLNSQPHQQQTYQFNGQTYQYGYPQAPAIPNAGFQGQQQQQQYPQQNAWPPPSYYQGQQQQPYGAYPSAPIPQPPQQQLNPQQAPPPNIDISSILNRLGVHQPGPQ